MDDTAHDPTLQEAGELEALRRFLPLLPPGEGTEIGPGDDAAVVRAGDGRFVVTTDTMLEGADFRLDWSSWHDLGWKAVATNLIDVAAMGARPTSLVVALAVAPSTRVSALEAFARGLADAIEAMAPGCGVVGGDLGTAPSATVAVTAFGDLGGRAPVLRSGARPTDAVWCAGALGLAATGLRTLFAEADAQAEAAAAKPASRPAAAGSATAGSAATGSATAARDAAERLRVGVRGRAVEAQLAPTTPVAAGALLAELGATAMLDVSDGLALDAARVARASAVRIALEHSLVADAAQEAIALGSDLDAALHGGEDHALLFTLPVGVTPPDELAGHRVHRLGIVEPLAGGEQPGVTLDAAPLEPRGWDPYRATAQ